MGIKTIHEQWMTYAIDQAKNALHLGEVPVGAVIVRDNHIVGQGHNQVISTNDPTAHAEIVAIRHVASSDNNYRTPGTTLYVTLEPCMMCAGSLIHARIERVIYGARDPKTGIIDSCDQLLAKKYHNHQIQHFGGVLENECGMLLKNFFKEKRNTKKYAG